jgi:hypothetical protein
LAARQHGYVTRSQLLDLGLSKSAIGRRSDLIATGHKGVYAVGHVERTPIALAHAAVLACGPAAVLSHESAAALWGLRRHWPSRPEVTSPHKRARGGIESHRSGLRGHDVTVNYGVRVTTIVRTVIDIAPRLTDRELIRAIQDGRHTQHLKPSKLQELLLRCPRARNLVDPTQNPTRSSLEDDFLAFVKRYDLPTPRINTRKSGTEVDAIFETEQVIVELDSWEFHGDPIAFHRDKARDTARAADGLLPLRLTSDRFTAEGADELCRILSRRRRG